MTSNPLTEIRIETPIGPITAPLETLSESLSFLANKVRKTDKVDQSIEEFLGNGDDSTEFSIESKRKFYFDRSYVFWMEAFMGVIEKSWNIVKVENYNHGENRTAPVWFDERVGDRVIKVPHKLIMFVEHKTHPNTRFVTTFTPYDEYEVDVMTQFRSDVFDYSRFHEDHENYFYQQGSLKGAHFDASYQMLDAPEMDWDAIIIKPEDRHVLDRNLTRFIDSVGLFQSKGLRSSRGVLLTGPPGTGKTLTCKVLINQLTSATVIYVARDSITDVGQITALYKMARKLAPSVVILEDIDTLGGLSREDADHPVLGEFLNCLAGVEDNHGVVTLATTNHPEKLDWALTDRPGRFDVRLDFGYPDEKHRENILSKYLTPFKTGKVNLSRIAKDTDKFTGAYLQEIIQSAFMLAHEECDYCEEPVINQSHLDMALSHIKTQREVVGREKNLAYADAGASSSYDLYG